MGRLSSKLLKFLAFRVDQSQTADRCGVMEMLGYKPRAAAYWVRPKLGQGPANYGLKHFGCRDCGCISFDKRGHNGSLIYVANEYAQDVAFQTDDIPTSQHLIGAYLGAWPRDLCIVNTGFHNVNVPKMSDEIYVANVRTFLKLLSPGCQSFVWVHTSAVRGTPFLKSRFPQRNAALQRWNRLVEALVADDLRHNDGVSPIFVLDVFSMSNQPDLHQPPNDNVHMIPAYYSALAKILASAILRVPRGVGGSITDGEGASSREAAL